MEKTGWKIIAIIFICLFILSSLLIVSFYKLGSEVIKNENECSINICSDYETFFYDSYEEICYCFIDGEVEYSEFIN